MLGTVKQFFDSFLNPGADDAGTTRQHKLQLACAALLFELTAADQHRSEEELALLRIILRDSFQLDEHALDRLWDLGQLEARSATSLYQFTSLINEGFGYQQKTALLEQLWLLAFADHRLDMHEEHLIRKIADLLYLSHADFIRAKLAAREASQAS
jgi:uncharacterized tellurite resistance protein B-like protein